MPIATIPLTRRGKRGILAFSFLASLLIGFLLVEDAIDRYQEVLRDERNRQVGIQFSKDDFFPRRPAPVLLLVPLVTIAMALGWFWISTGLTILGIGLFLMRCYLLVMNARDFGYIGPVIDLFNLGDLLFAIFLVVIMSWHLSIFLGRLNSGQLEI